MAKIKVSLQLFAHLIQEGACIVLPHDRGTVHVVGGLQPGDSILEIEVNPEEECFEIKVEHDGKPHIEVQYIAVPSKGTS